MKALINKRMRRHRRVRASIRTSSTRPRLSIFRSNKHIYAQIIDDRTGKTLAAATDRPAAKSKKAKSSLAKVAEAKLVGQKLAAAALANKVNRVAFDRGGYLYTGRVRALAEGAREGGLSF